MKHRLPDGFSTDHRASVTISGQQSQRIIARGHNKLNVLDMLTVRGQILQYEEEYKTHVEQCLHTLILELAELDKLQS